MTREALLELQDYDLWANRRWLAVLPQMPNAAHATEIFGHILMAQQNWLIRVMSEEEAGVPSSDLATELERLYAAWRDILVNCDPNAYASYERMGQAHFHMVSEIAHHVFNHGSYHRGHLRGLADAAGLVAFPETDMILWFRETAS